MNNFTEDNEVQSANDEVSCDLRSAESETQLDAVNVIDSQSVSMPVAFLCRIAAECESLDVATEAVRDRVPKARVLALLDTLRYLEMGGRLSRAQAMIGTMLDLKPLLLVANAEIKPVDRVRTRSRAVSRMVDYFKNDLPVEHVGVVHAQAPDEADQIAPRWMVP